MFLDNSYSRAYHSLIRKAQQDQRKKSPEYEEHHIEPRSLGGSDKASNKVLLTLKEHYVAHKLLVKAVEEKHWYKMWCALVLMQGSWSRPQISHGLRYKTAAAYARDRRMSKMPKELHPLWGSNNTRGMKWIKNLSTGEQRRVLEENMKSFLDSGWVLGRIYNSDRVHHVINESTGEVIRVSKSELDNFLALGWRRGNKLATDYRRHPKTNELIKITQDRTGLR